MAPLNGVSHDCSNTTLPLLIAAACGPPRKRLFCRLIAKCAPISYHSFNQLARDSALTKDSTRRSQIRPLANIKKLLNSDLGRIRGNNLRNPSEFGYFARHTNPLSWVILLRVSELGEVSTPDHNLKDLLRIWFVEIYENRIFPVSSRITCTRNLPTHGSVLADMVLGVFSRDVILPLTGERRKQQDCPNSSTRKRATDYYVL